MGDVPSAIDGRGREISYLRVSVTPRCNLRCAYCFPEGGQLYPQRYDILSLRQIARLVAIFSGAGIRKARITGGEPLVRKGIATLISDIRKIEGIEEITLTTNGVLLEGMIPRLKQSGVDRVNISLDSLKPERVKAISGYDVFPKVMGAIEKIISGGVWPLKINVVAIKGVNDDETLDFAELAVRFPLEVRFIEMMPVAHNKLWKGAAAISGAEIKKIIEETHVLTPVADAGGIRGPAEVYTIGAGTGRIGFVSPISKHFCGGCNRLRLTAEGSLRSCLFSGKEVDLKEGFETGQPDDWFLARFYEALSGKPDGHNLASTRAERSGRPMMAIGG
jgi:cyclic pyranopterin phosphate synthase